MARIDPYSVTGEEDFDPDNFTAADAAQALADGIAHFDDADYHAAHEDFERCWLANEAGDADFYKGLIQASICMHHFQRGNIEGARKLYSGHRKLLGAYLPAPGGVDVAAFLAEMQRALSAVLRAREDPPAFDRASRPRLPRI